MHSCIPLWCGKHVGTSKDDDSKDIDKHRNTTAVNAPTFWQKLQGVPNKQSPPRPSAYEIGVSGLGLFTGVSSLALMHYGICNQYELTMILGSFGATNILLFGGRCKIIVH